MADKKARQCPILVWVIQILAPLAHAVEPGLQARYSKVVYFMTEQSCLSKVRSNAGTQEDSQGPSSKMFVAALFFFILGLVKNWKDWTGTAWLGQTIAACSSGSHRLGQYTARRTRYKNILNCSLPCPKHNRQANIHNTIMGIHNVCM